MTMSYLKKLSVEDALNTLAEELEKAIKPVVQGERLGADSLLELDGLAALCRMYAVDAAHGELAVAGKPGAVCEVAGALYLEAEAIEAYLEESMMDSYPDGTDYMFDLVTMADVQTALDDLQEALQKAGLLEDEDTLYCMAGTDGDEVELDDGMRMIHIDGSDEELCELVSKVESAMIAACLLEEGESLVFAGGPDNEDDENDSEPKDELGAPQEAMKNLVEAILEAGLLEKGESLCVSVVDGDIEPEIGEGQRLICYDSKIKFYVDALKATMVGVELMKEDQELVLLAGTGFDVDEDEENLDVEVLSMAELDDDDAERVKIMSDLLFQTGALGEDQGIQIIRMAQASRSGKPFITMSVGNGTVLSVVPD